MPKRGYHHGNLRQALVEAGIQPVDAVGGDETGGVQPEWLLPE